MSFLFDRNFDAETDAAARGAAQVAGAVFTRAEFDQAVAEARAAGFEAGVQQGRSEAHEAALSSETARRLKVAESVVPLLRDLFEDAARHHAALEAQMIDFVLSVFEQVAPDVSASLAEGQARREAQAAVRMALGAAQLTLFFAPDSLTAATPELEAAAREARFGGRLTLRPDPALQPGDVRADWDQGVMSYSFAEVCGRILGTLGLARDEIDKRLGQKVGHKVDQKFSGEPS